MLRIGITGLIGSGKSTVCRLFALLGAPCYDSDSRAKNLMDNDRLLQQRLVELFGAQTIDTSGRVDRARLAAEVFADQNRLAQLNAIVHPAVRDDFEQWAEQQRLSGAKYAILESAILFSSRFDRCVEQSVVVVCPRELRVDRVVGRSGLERRQIEQRMAAQWSDEELIRRSDFTIRNDEHCPLWPQVLRLNSIFSR